MNFYTPIYNRLPFENYKIDPSYYELRKWVNHEITDQKQFKTLKMARKYYKDKLYDIEEEEGTCYIEITRIKPLKK